ncbi:MAG TPA: hypothetical protein VF189_01715 [Patescibacteria group bacterium]
MEKRERTRKVNSRQTDRRTANSTRFTDPRSGALYELKDGKYVEVKQNVIGWQAH